MNELKKVKDCKGCEGCPMRELFPDNTFVSPQFGHTLRIAVGEAPGQEEQDTGKPFQGGAGRWLHNLYNKAGLHKADITIVNIIQCRPPENVFPTHPDARSYISPSDASKAVKQCVRNHVLPLLEGRKWTRIDILGDTALEWLTGLTSGIFKWRGSPLEVDTDAIRKRVG